MKPDDKEIWKRIDRKENHYRKKNKRTEDFQTVDAVVDLKAANQLQKLQSTGFIGSITGTIASGKESGVFIADLGPKGEDYCKALLIESPIVIKIFRTSTLNFKRMKNYLVGDIRFRRYSKSTRKIINMWVEKEFQNLHRSSLVNLNVPKPILVRNNILLMQLLGEKGIPYPLLKYTPEAATKSILSKIIEQTKILFQQAGLVHADLSPFNILIGNRTPYFIDMSQSVLVSHPQALNFLERDLTNIFTYFSTKSIDIPDIKQIYEEITVDLPDKNLIH